LVAFACVVGLRLGFLPLARLVTLLGSPGGRLVTLGLFPGSLLAGRGLF